MPAHLGPSRSRSSRMLSRRLRERPDLISLEASSEHYNCTVTLMNCAKWVDSGHTAHDHHLQVFPEAGHRMWMPELCRSGAMPPIQKKSLRFALPTLLQTLLSEFHVSSPSEKTPGRRTRSPHDWSGSFRDADFAAETV